MANQAGLPPNEGAVQQEEPGMMDNRLSITPSDFPAVADWEDGQTYKLTELGDDVTIRQISPGEFEVLPGPPQPGEQGEEEAEAAPVKKKRGGYGNPAVENLANED